MARTRQGSALTIGLVAISITAIITTGIFSFPTPRMARKRPTPPPPAGAVMLAARLGLDPQALAAADVTAAQTHTAAGAIVTYWSENGNTIMAKDTELIALDKSLADIRSAIAAGHPPANAEATIASTQTQRQALAAERDAMLAAAYAAASTDLNASQLSMLQTIKSNRIWQLPTHMLVVQRQPSEWVALQHAGAPTIDIHDPRIPSNTGASPLESDPIWTTASANQTVSAAAQRIQANGAEIEAAWRAELMPAP